MKKEKKGEVAINRSGGLLFMSLWSSLLPGTIREQVSQRRIPVLQGS